jgi:hypothetical protein
MFKKTASTMKYTVARTKTADFKIRVTWILQACIPPAEGSLEPT